MKQKTGIFAILLLAALLLFGVWRQGRQEEEPEDTQEAQLVMQEEAKTQSVIRADTEKVRDGTRYIARLTDGNLVVYLSDNETVYMETGIRSQSFDGEILEQAKEGIRFSSEEKLFEFLESYSS